MGIQLRRQELMPMSLYYQNGAAYGLTVQSGADSRFTFNINSNSIDIGSMKVMCYDVNGDNTIDVVDLNMIAQRMNEKTGTSYPAVDVNGDGTVDIHDVTLVSGQIEG